MPQLVETGLDRSAIKPALGIFTIGFSVHRPFQADFDGQFLSARRVPNYLRDYSSEARVMSTKNPLDIRPGIVGFGSNNVFTDCVHADMSPLGPIL